MAVSHRGAISFGMMHIPVGLYTATQDNDTVKYMMKTESGGLRQPVFKGLRDDKRPEECMED